MDSSATKQYIDQSFQPLFVEPLSDFTRIPNLTPAFDSDYFTNGLIEKAIEFVASYADSLEIDGLEYHVHQEDNVAPMVVFTYQGTGSPNVMIYGHLDKQPHMEGWREGTGPTEPAVIQTEAGERLYGRGVADDAFTPFAVLLAIKNALLQGASLPRIALVLETEEESGSNDLIPLLEKCHEWIQDPDICLCLDSGILDYTTVWLTTSLRGMVGFNLKVSVVDIAAHSGVAGGIIPETFRIANALLNRLEDPLTLQIPLLEVEIPERFYKEAEDISQLQGEKLFNCYSFIDGVQAINQDDLAKMYLNVNWHPSLAVTGADGLPPLARAGNVLRTSTSIRVAIRLPPTKDSNEAFEQISEVLTKDPPFGAKVEILNPIKGDGWCMKELSEKTSSALENATKEFYSSSFKLYGDGGSIPFLKILGDKYPNTEIMALGVQGVDSNIHAPDENLDLTFAKKFICSLSHMLADLA